ncbi:MAG: class I SAM-dependent methyltransferase [Planctomycetes bacterium]|nr:class I SAM-dependent methyltransferase [Planctomycetota bacterium]
MHPERERWNLRFSTEAYEPHANVHLIMYRDRLARGRALDVAAGTGENAVILALAGWEVTACDLSDEAVRRAKRRAAELKARLAVVQADATRLPFKDAQFDTVVCTHYLDRDAARRLPKLLRPGGTIYFQAYTLDHLKYKPDFRREFCLEPGELKTLFAGLTEVLHREEDDGRKATALAIMKHP